MQPPHCGVLLACPTLVASQSSTFKLVTLDSRSNPASSQAASDTAATATTLGLDALRSMPVAASSPQPSHRTTLNNSTASDFSRVSRSLLAGGIAGCCAKTLTAPLDRVKTLFQGSNPHFAHYSGSVRGTFQALAEIVRSEGIIRGAFKGHSATLARIFPYAALNFMCYDQFKRLLMPLQRPPAASQRPQQSTALQSQSNLAPFPPNDSGSDALLRLCAGSLAGICSVLLTYPLDYVHSRITYQVKLQRYNGIFQTMRATVAEGAQTHMAETRCSPLVAQMRGFTSLYRGLAPTLMGIIPYAGVSFCCYDTLKHAAQRRSPDGRTASTPAMLVCGAIAGAAAQTAAYPFDVVRRRMQLYGLSSALPLYRDTWHALSSIVKTSGYKGLFVGLSINYVKVAPAHAISFLVYEKMKRMLAVEHGISGKGAHNR